ncbi:MAG: winged helix-turn-helix domain-containing protein [Nitrososphaeraceae archaeon]
MGYRNRIEIIGQILDVVNDHGNGIGVTRNTLMYEVFLSSAQLREYLTALTVHGLLAFNSEKRRYNITLKGLRYLELCNKLCDTMKEEQGQH